MTKLNVFCIENNSSGGTAYKVFVFSSHNTVQKFITNKTKNLTVHVGWLTRSLFLHTSLEIRRWWLFLMRTLTGLWTSSEDVPDAWSLSPSEPIFTFSWTMPGRHTDANCNSVESCCLIQLRNPWWLFLFMHHGTHRVSIGWQIVFCSFRKQRSNQHNVFKS